MRSVPQKQIFFSYERHKFDFLFFFVNEKNLLISISDYTEFSIRWVESPKKKIFFQSLSFARKIEVETSFDSPRDSNCHRFVFINEQCSKPRIWMHNSKIKNARLQRYDIYFVTYAIKATSFRIVSRIRSKVSWNDRPVNRRASATGGYIGNSENDSSSGWFP